MIYYVFAMAAVLLTGLSHVLLKIGANGARSALGAYFNVPIVFGYGLFLMATMCDVFSLQGLDLKLFYALSSLSYIVIAGLSMAILKEKLTGHRLFAIFLIVAGLIVFNL